MICRYRSKRLRMRRRRLHASSTTQGDPRKTSGPRIDRIPSTRPPWRVVKIAKKKNSFFGPQRMSRRSLWTSS